MSSNYFIIPEKKGFTFTRNNREEWHNENLENIIRLYNIFENVLTSRIKSYKCKTDNDKFNKFSRLIYMSSSYK